MRHDGLLGLSRAVIQQSESARVLVWKLLYVLSAMLILQRMDSQRMNAFSRHSGVHKSISLRSLKLALDEVRDAVLASP